MKVTSAILTLYILSLVVLPCTDTMATLDSNGQVEIQADVHHSHTKPAADLCSPFCFCHCCHTCTTTNSLSPINHSVPAIVYNSTYKSPFTKSCPFSVFHPPKV